MPSAISAIRIVHPRTVGPVGRLAIRSLHTELVLSPKPGLVSPLDPGSHTDMDAGTFVRSMFALRCYFVDIAAAGAAGAPFRDLQALGQLAERRMLRATNGINTHRGAIFSLGLIAAAASWLIRRRRSLAGDSIGRSVSSLWGSEIAAARASSPEATSHGLMVAGRYGVGGAREEACAGFPSIWSVGLPTIRHTIGQTRNKRLALIQSLFSLMAELDDTNVLYRGGRSGLTLVRASAQEFLDCGGVYRHDWEAHALSVHRRVTSLGLSPGGSADMLAASWFIYQVQKTYAWV